VKTMMERACPRACSDGVCPTGSAFAVRMHRLKRTKKLVDELLGVSAQWCNLPAKAQECWQNLRKGTLNRRLSLEEVFDLAFVAQIDIRFCR
jgi:hypothetical protein